ncbi:MAG: HAD family hydrolase [Clostridiales bacterium]|nr:HAD family hydrolase [Clostridiales bacterium]
MKTIIFDLDGTLCDTLADITVSLNRVLAAKGYQAYSFAEVSGMVGRGAPHMIAAAAKGATSEELSELSLAYFEDYARHLSDTTRPYAGISETLTELRARGFTLAVVTNKPHAHAVRLAQELFPPHGQIFARVQGQSQKFATKPNPESLLFVLASLGVSPDEAIYVGDSDVDLAFAQNAGLPFVGCAWGYRGRERLLEAGAEVVIDKPEELLKL